MIRSAECPGAGAQRTTQAKKQLRPKGARCFLRSGKQCAVAEGTQRDKEARRPRTGAHSRPLLFPQGQQGFPFLLGEGPPRSWFQSLVQDQGAHGQPLEIDHWLAPLFKHTLDLVELSLP